MSLALASCASSTAYVDAPKPLPGLPKFVRDEANRPPTSIPKDPQKLKGARTLATDMRVSETSYRAALRAAVKAYDRVRARLNKKAKP